MKKIAAIALGLGLVLGSVSFAQDKMADSKSTAKKADKGTAKKAEKGTGKKAEKSTEKK